MANWPPFQIANVFVFASGGVGPNASYGYISASRPSTGVYEVVLNYSVFGAMQARTVTYVNVQGAGGPDVRVSAIELVAADPYTIRYTIRDGAGAPLNIQHIVKVTQS